MKNAFFAICLACLSASLGAQSARLIYPVARPPIVALNTGQSCGLFTLEPSTGQCIARRLVVDMVGGGSLSSAPSDVTLINVANPSTTPVTLSLDLLTMGSGYAPIPVVDGVVGIDLVTGAINSVFSNVTLPLFTQVNGLLDFAAFGNYPASSNPLFMWMTFRSSSAAAITEALATADVELLVTPVNGKTGVPRQLALVVESSAFEGIVTQAVGDCSNLLSMTNSSSVPVRASVSLFNANGTVAANTFVSDPIQPFETFPMNLLQGCGGGGMFDEAGLVFVFMA